MFITKMIARKPITGMRRYPKFGYLIVECEAHYCPWCGSRLNAGPEYQPKYCDQCGQKLNFKEVEWKEEKEIGRIQEECYEPFKDRVV